MTDPKTVVTGFLAASAKGAGKVVVAGAKSLIGKYRTRPEVER